ncbi:MAG TPA: type I-U CRISPR-associated RAMP protein Csb1/Cas7u [Thermoguttaceae bacterium]|nr:type I-U CRISPR-associated RAMP protein Csb1/Cas7u [Thermoguttaceae bacterium]
MSELSKFDHYLTDAGPAALVIREHLMPVEGADGVLFPATFAAGDGFPGGYNINTFADEKGSKNVCLIDSVGSQANRLEPLFMQAKYQHLVPRIVVKAGEHEVNILEAGHRAGDALLRCSQLQQQLQDAFKAVLAGDAEPLARIAPTSLVFGVWDSRNTQAKLPRLVSSTIRAFDVRRLTRGAVYIPPVDYAEMDVFSEEEKAKAEGNNKSPLAQRGFVHNPASGSHGGVIADGGIRRDATLGLAAVRLLHADRDEQKTLVLRRYILGLSLVTFTSKTENYLRQGCMLVLATDQPREFVEMYPDGKRLPCKIPHDVALAYATEAAKAFGVGESRTVMFEKDRARRDVKADGDKKAKTKRSKKSDAATDETEVD